MNTDIHPVPRELPAHALVKLSALKHWLSGAIVAAPAVLMSLSLMQTRLAWPHASWIMLGILALVVADFLMLVLIEPYRARIGDLTIPAFLLFIGMAFSYIVTETLNRFVSSYGFGWLTPVAIVALALIYGGVLRERYLLLKLVLALNGIALSVLWCLGDADKVALPF